MILEILEQSGGKKNEKHPNWKGQRKAVIFVDDMILYIENPRDSSKKSVRIKKFSKVAEYEVCIEKLVVFLHTNNKLTEREIKERIPFTMHQRE